MLLQQYRVYFTESDRCISSYCPDTVAGSETATAWLRVSTMHSRRHLLQSRFSTVVMLGAEPLFGCISNQKSIPRNFGRFGIDGILSKLLIPPGLPRRVAPVTIWNLTLNDWRPVTFAPRCQRAAESSMEGGAVGIMLSSYCT